MLKCILKDAYKDFMRESFKNLPNDISPKCDFFLPSNLRRQSIRIYIHLIFIRFDIAQERFSKILPEIRKYSGRDLQGRVRGNSFIRGYASRAVEIAKVSQDRKRRVGFTGKENASREMTYFNTTNNSAYPHIRG